MRVRTAFGWVDFITRGSGEPKERKFCASIALRGAVDPVAELDGGNTDVLPLL
ncbi:MAG: hypothetical protein IIB61_03335 [Planctomycetes bacterium]|nr:hypothetical protein [Planctomycetota bacterium]